MVGALQDVAAGLPLPARFTDAVAKAKREFLAADYTDLRMKTLKALIAGERVDVNQADWSRLSVDKLASLLAVAEVGPRRGEGARGGAAGERAADARAGAGAAGGRRRVRGSA